MPALTIPPPRPYVKYMETDGTLTIQGYDLLFGLYRRVGGSLDSLNAALLLDKTWAEPDGIGTVTRNVGKFTDLDAINFTATNITYSGAINLSPANQDVTISPTGTGSFITNGAATGYMDNVIIGHTTPKDITAAKFGCNGQSPQATHTSIIALGSYSAGANGLASAALMQKLFDSVVEIRAALFNNGIMDI